MSKIVNCIAFVQSPFTFRGILIVFFLLLFPGFTSFSQRNTSIPRISTTVGVSRFDIFHSVGLSTTIQCFEPEISIGYGINRTVFQQRFFPKTSLSTSFNFIQKEKFELGVMLQYALSGVKLNASSKYRNVWNEFNGGIEWEYGRKWRIGQQLLFGRYAENYYNTLYVKRVSVSGWGYFLSIKLSHEL